MQILHPLHVALQITDLDRAAHFYGTVLGLPQVDRVLRFPGLWYQVGHFQLHLLADETAVQAGNTLKAIPPDPIPPDQKWGRHPHVAFAVADLAQIQTRLQAHHCPIQPSASGRAALFTQDPDGNILELNQA
jgi:catechol 2,3-dioxygenase-like lactoylglutathione lyase family enzyme